MGIFKKIITATYRLRMGLSRLTGMGIGIRGNRDSQTPPEPFYSLKATLNNGEEISFERFRGKKILVVNLASQCGYTPQYEQLEQLHQMNKEVLVLGFPANNFGAQEPGTDKEIAAFCQVNFGVSFPLFKKNDVKGQSKQPVYRWLTDKTKNGWNEMEPKWNFYKYLIDEKGRLAGVFSSSVSPLDIQ